MHLSLVVLFAAPLVSAFTAVKRHNDVPACAAACVANADPSPCSNTDTPCLCVNPKYITAVANCVQSSCSPKDAEAAAASGEAYCKAAVRRLMYSTLSVSLIRPQTQGVDPKNPFPSCGNLCVQNAPRGDCPEEDSCLCKRYDYIQYIVTCLQYSCAGQELKTALFVGEALCRAAGVDVSSIVDANS